MVHRRDESVQRCLQHSAGCVAVFWKQVSSNWGPLKELEAGTPKRGGITKGDSDSAYPRREGEGRGKRAREERALEGMAFEA